MSGLAAHHIKTTLAQKILLGTGSSLAALVNPYRGDMVAVCGETTACRSLENIRSKMMEDVTGKIILKEKPRISSETMDLKLLRALPESTLGRQYVKMLDKYNITPDSRLPVRFVDDIELAYVLQRYREIHDFNHLLLGQPTNLRGEVVVKWFEAIQTGLPMCWLAALGGLARLNRKRRTKLLTEDLQWVISTAQNAEFFMNFYFEERLDQDIDEFQYDAGITAQKRTTKLKKSKSV
uniref:Ubiquinone biosynthesis protein COQ4 homolog, mitochondrial n=1 Tax=Phallusia mammillata TaxID=59560 RepID=A0A6F9DAN8_9ASCI|nr:ubiquinone biosynthesis protein COQ4 homolog, mitochondrial-like [Phallusia mammillata]